MLFLSKEEKAKLKKQRDLNALKSKRVSLQDERDAINELLKQTTKKIEEATNAVIE